MVTNFSDAYELTDLVVTPDQLLLDPTNPRIVLDTKDDMDFSPEELAEEDIQDYILSVINKEEYYVAQLVASIKQDGFLRHGNDMIVEEVNEIGKFLVIEGNRRTTAIKELLKNSHELEPFVYKSLQKIKVKEFVFTGDDSISREQIIFKLQGLIHISGPLSWGPIERAFYIYNSYMFEMKNADFGISFFYSPEFSRSVANLFNLTLRQVRKELMIYRVYEQLKSNRYPVRQDDYSLIELAISTRELNEEYFELDELSFQFSQDGLERFYTLCLREDKPINNPKEFRAFAKIYKEGTLQDIRIAELNSEPILHILNRLNDRKAEREFQNKLEKIQGLLADLPIHKFKDTTDEFNLIKEIARLVVEKLIALTK